MFLQFELWKQCSFGCKFCYNQGFTKTFNKLQNLQRVIDIMNSEEADQYDEFGIIGGEFFNGEISNKQVHKKFYELIDIMIDKLQKYKAKRCLVATSLMFEDSTEWLVFCKYLNDHSVTNRFLICTSFDIEYRFDEKKIDNWLVNMHLTKALYPDINLHVEMILTQFLIDSIMNDDFNIKQFEEGLQCRVDYAMPLCPYSYKYKNKQEMQKALPGFFPTRDSFLKFLQYMYENQYFNRQNIHELISADLHSDTCYMGFKDDDFYKMADRHKLEAKSNPQLTPDMYGYIDSNMHPRDDIELFLQMLGEE